MKLIPGADHRGLRRETQIDDLNPQWTIIRLPEHDVVEGARLLTCRVREFPHHTSAPLGEEIVARLNESLEDFLGMARH